MCKAGFDTPETQVRDATRLLRRRCGTRDRGSHSMAGCAVRGIDVCLRHINAGLQSLSPHWSLAQGPNDLPAALHTNPGLRCRTSECTTAGAARAAHVPARQVSRSPQAGRELVKVWHKVAVSPHQPLGGVKAAQGTPLAWGQFVTEQRAAASRRAAYLEVPAAALPCQSPRACSPALGMAAAVTECWPEACSAQGSRLPWAKLPSGRYTESASATPRVQPSPPRSCPQLPAGKHKMCQPCRLSL